MNPPVNLLLVDDDARNLDVLEAILTSPNYRLVRAQNADEALKALVTKDFAVIVLDIRMPGTSGFELAQIIKQRKKTQHLPIIFLTAYYQEDGQVLQGYGAGAVDYLSKPCNPDILRSKVAVFVDLFCKSRALEMEIAERRQAEQRVRELNEQLAQRVTELAAANEQLHIRACQLRTLTSELALAEQRERRRLTGILHDHLQQLLVGAKYRLSNLAHKPDKQVRQIARAVDELLDQSIEASRSLTAELCPPILHDGNIVAGLQWLARWMTDKHGLKVTLQADEELPVPGEDIKVLLFESVRELLFNVVKHAQVRAAKVSLHPAADQSLQIVVSDSGAGFDSTHLKLAGKSGKSIGLFSIRERLELIGGALEIDSTPGKGSRCTLTVPLGPTAGLKSAANLTQTVGLPAPTSHHKIRVLLVDDHAVLREGLTRLLVQESNLEIVGEAADGQTAVKLANTLQPDVILMDISMPKLNGIEATRQIHQKLPGIRIIGLSMLDEAEQAQAMREAGAVHYLSKSSPSPALLAALHAPTS